MQTTPRGVQLYLGMGEDECAQDTLVMANLGYFQLKARPALCMLRLAPGRSQDLYTILSTADSPTASYYHNSGPQVRWNGPLFACSGTGTGTGMTGLCPLRDPPSSENQGMQPSQRLCTILSTADSPTASYHHSSAPQVQVKHSFLS